MACVEIKNVSLSYPIYGANARSFKSTLISVATGGRLNRDSGNMKVEALRDVSLKLEEGDRLAIIGHNGAGKSTLLKVLANIYEPTKGVVNVKGSTNCLFDIMMGMEQELNGYENIMIRGMILGLSKSEIRKIIPSVEEFSELGDFMKMPIKSYSAGMKVRLAFGIITSVHSDILLIDEIVNVGDANFIEKAKARMNHLIYQSEFVVLSTHDIGIVQALCNKVLWLERGVVRNYGPTAEVLANYQLS